MSTSYKAQINNFENDYRVQFETNNYDYFKMVERECQKAIDNEHCSQDKVETIYKEIGKMTE